MDAIARSPGMAAVIRARSGHISYHWIKLASILVLLTLQCTEDVHESFCKHKVLLEQDGIVTTSIAYAIIIVTSVLCRL